MTCPREISKSIPKCCPYEEKLVGDQNGETESCEIDSTTSNYHMSISINGHIYTEEELKKEGKFKHEEQKVTKEGIPGYYQSMHKNRVKNDRIVLFF